FLDSLACARTEGDVAGEALILANIGLLYAEKGDLASAVPQLKAGLAICERHGIVNTRALILANLAEMALQMNDFDAAAEYGNGAVEIAQATGNRYVASYMKL